MFLAEGAALNQPFAKPHSINDLVLMSVDKPQPGVPLAVADAYYRESCILLRLRFNHIDDVFADDPDLIASSTSLFWEMGTFAQVLLTGEAEFGFHWRIGLTAYGVLRWEIRDDHDRVVLELESKYPITALVDLSVEFAVGIALTSFLPTDHFGFSEEWCRAQNSASLHIGRCSGSMLACVAKTKGFFHEQLCPIPSSLSIPAKGQSCSFDGIIENMTVANTRRIALVNDPQEDNQSIRTDMPGGACLLARRIDPQTLEIFSGVESIATTNYWKYVVITNPDITRVLVDDFSDMGTSFFASGDGSSWQRLQATIRPSATGGLSAQLELPPRQGALHVAHAPVYGENGEASDLVAAEEMGAQVVHAATSTGGRPVHVVKLTDRDTADDGKIAVVMLCGQHSPVEQTGGWLGLPCLNRLAALNQTNGLLKKLIFYWVPLFNVDCAHYGLPGNTLALNNPNRVWFNDRGPEHEGVQAYFKAEEERFRRMVLMLDVHGGGLWRNHNLLTNFMSPEENGIVKPVGPDLPKERIIEAFFRIAGIREVWRQSNEGKLVGAPHWFQHEFECPAFSLELSMVSCYGPDRQKSTVVTQEELRKTGEQLANLIAWLVEPAAGIP